MNKLDAAIREALDILLSERPTHEAVIVLRKALGQDVFGDAMKPRSFDAREIGITLNQEPQEIAHMPKIFHGLWR